ncbi:putative late blight resistance protein homolog R1B-13 [Henckelia pumila]|uniref:putative late blight resistance protein homolog R1B-13 n=1 Tax=Henckelia pumila TaxID=405737 RepID=UPI003C6E88E3
MHDLLRDFCITEAQKEKFLHFTNENNIHSKGIRSERRVTIQPVSHLESIRYAFNSNGPPSPTRSLLLYHEYAVIIVSEPSFGLLRVLDMVSRRPLTRFPKEIVRLVHLRYLSLCCLGDKVPAYISSLWALQTLVINIRSGDFTYLPMELWKMLHLRHVEIRNGYCELPDPPNSNFVILANLQTLSGIINFRFTDEIIKRIPKLKKLKVHYRVGYADWSHYHLSNIGCLNELKSLDLSSFSKMAFLRNFKFPAALKKLTLYSCRLGWEDLTMVGSLPNLEVLKLNPGACQGQVWEPNEGEFCHLKSLQLYCLDLVEWRADSSHFPELERLKIGGCRKLKEIQTEIGNIPALEKIELDHGNTSSALASAKLILDQQRSFDNDVPQLCIL